MIFWCVGCLLSLVAAGGVLAQVDVVARLEGVLAQALEANEQLAALVERQGAENARLREQLAVRDGELDRVTAELAVLKRMLFGRSSERGWPGTSSGDGGGDQARPAGGGKAGKRGPGARAGRRDYSHLPRVEVVWDFPGGGYCCPECGTPFTGLGDHVSGAGLGGDRAGERALPPPLPAGVRLRGPGHGTAPGPAKAIGKGLVSNAFIAQWLTERYVPGAARTR